MDFWADVVSNLIGAGAGVFLGYWFGVRQERKMRKEEERALKKEAIESLVQELDYNSTLLGDEAVIVMGRTTG